jgi:hypothetical protein
MPSTLGNMLVMTSWALAIAPTAHMQADDVPLPTGDHYFDNTEEYSEPHVWAVGDDSVRKKELHCIQLCISSMTRPLWHTPPPSNLGEASHGKLQMTSGLGGGRS